MNKCTVYLIVLLLLCCLVVSGQSPVGPIIKWKFSSDAPVRGGMVTDEIHIYFGNSGGSIYCLNKSDGKEIWKINIGEAITSAPLLIEDKVVVAGRDVALVALSKQDGKLVWKFERQKGQPHTWGWDYYTSGPVAFKNNLIVGSGDKKLYAINSNIGKSDWEFEAKDKIRATPLIANGEVWVPAFDGMLYVLSANKGTLKRKFETEGVNYYGKVFGWDRSSIITQPAIKDNTIIFGSRDGGLYSLDTKNLSQNWRFSYGSSWVGSSPLIDNDKVFVGWSDSHLFTAIDFKTGKELWNYNCHAYVYSTPVINDEKVYAGAFDGMLYAFGKSSGDVLWNIQIGSSIISPLLWDEERLYVGNDNGELLAIEEKSVGLKAVYLPKMYKKNELLADERIVPFLIGNNYQQLDTATLEVFLQNRIDDQVPSVVVFAHEYLPKRVSGTNAQQSLLKAYMENGGKVVWLGSAFPNFWTADKEMNIVGYSDQYARDLLGLKFDLHMDLGAYYAKTTPDGTQLGLPASFITPMAAIANDSEVVPLAFNELGRIAAFWKPFGKGKFSGFISFRSWGYMPAQPSDLEIIKTIAEKGL